MDNFDEKKVNGTDFPENDATEKKNVTEERESTDPGVVFNEDGTYHGKTAYTEEPVSSPSSDIPDNEKFSGYPYENRTEEERNGRTEYPYHSRTEKPEGGKTSSPYSSNGYPYSDKREYPYSSSRGSEPYSRPPEPTDGRNPYSYRDSSDRREYSYDRPDRSYEYAYSEDEGKGKKKKNGTKIFAIVAGILCVFLVVALVSVVLGDNDTAIHPYESTTGSVSENVDEFATNASPETGNTSTTGEMTPKSIYNKILPSSVGILVYDKSKTLASEGTGVLFSESTDAKYTYIVTCAHVINASNRIIMVQLYDDSKYEAEVVGFDVRTDIGVLRIEKTGLTLAEVGDSSKISVGDYIYAIGNPGGVEFANSFTDGIVSALDRPVNSSETGYTTECIQHTAAINPGNSGGALVNSFGQVIGINSMKIVDDEYEGMGFAVPSSVFVEVVNEILKNGYVSNRPKLGITYVAASEYSTYGMYVAIKGLPSGAIVIYEISSDSSFVGTEVQEGDMIVAVNGVGLDSASYLSEVIENSSVGDKLTLSIVRIYDDYSSKEFDVTVTLVEDRGDTVIAEEETTSSNTYSGGNYEDYFEQYFEDYFGNYFGGGYNP